MKHSLRVDRVVTSCRLFAAIVLVLGLVSVTVRAEEPQAPWPAPVKGFVPPAPGEHPRLLFRKGDVPALRKRAETPEGKAILARLRFTLGGNGESLPEKYNETRKSYDVDPSNFPVGTWTMWHMSGYGFLYVVTGDKKYAELSRKCVEQALEGQRDRDDRYAFNPPASNIRTGPALQAMAMAYDFCYDAWPEDFRKQIALEIQNFKKRGNKPKSSHTDCGLDLCATKPEMDPGSNHWPPQVGGAVFAILAIENDPGTDAALLKKYRDATEKNLIRQLTEGWGNYGYFAEGQCGPGGMASHTALVPAFQVMKVAGGKDFISPRPNAQWVTLHMVHQLVRKGNACYEPLRTKADGTYGGEMLSRKNLSHGGQFGQGFGALANDDQRAAMLWVYKNFVEPGEVEALKPSAAYETKDTVLKPGEKSWDVTVYPHRGVFSFINWPIGMEPKNPGDVIPKAVFDSIFNYISCRNQWKDDNDILVTALLGKGPGGPYKVNGGPVKIWGLGMKLNIGNISGSAASEPPLLYKDGSAIVRFGDAAAGRALGVDLSKSSGADALIVLTGEGKTGEEKGPGGTARTTVVQVGGQNVAVVTLQAAAAPAVNADGNTITVGGQTVKIEDGKLTFGKMPSPLRK